MGKELRDKDEKIKDLERRLVESEESRDDWHKNCLNEQQRAISAERRLTEALRDRDGWQAIGKRLAQHVSPPVAEASGEPLMPDFDLSWADEDPGRCPDCRAPWEWVRPGKAQPTCECGQTDVPQPTAASEERDLDKEAAQIADDMIAHGTAIDADLRAPQPTGDHTDRRREHDNTARTLIGFAVADAKEHVADGTMLLHWRVSVRLRKRIADALAARDVITPQPTSDHTERAREVLSAVPSLDENGYICEKAKALPAVAAALTTTERAGVDKITKWLEARAIAIRDHGPKSSEGLLTGIAGAHVGALFDAAAALRAAPLDPSSDHIDTEKMRALDEAVVEAAHEVASDLQPCRRSR